MESLCRLRRTESAVSPSPRRARAGFTTLIGHQPVHYATASQREPLTMATVSSPRRWHGSTPLATQAALRQVAPPSKVPAEHWSPHSSAVASRLASGLAAMNAPPRASADLPPPQQHHRAVHVSRHGSISIHAAQAAPAPATPVPAIPPMSMPVFTPMAPVPPAAAIPLPPLPAPAAATVAISRHGSVTIEHAPRKPAVAPVHEPVEPRAPQLAEPVAVSMVVRAPQPVALLAAPPAAKPAVQAWGEAASTPQPTPQPQPPAVQPAPLPAPEASTQRAPQRSPNPAQVLAEAKPSWLRSPEDEGTMDAQLRALLSQSTAARAERTPPRARTARASSSSSSARVSRSGSIVVSSAMLPVEETAAAVGGESWAAVDEWVDEVAAADAASGAITIEAEQHISALAATARSTGEDAERLARASEHLDALRRLLATPTAGGAETKQQGPAAWPLAAPAAAKVHVSRHGSITLNASPKPQPAPAAPLVWQTQLLPAPQPQSEAADEEHLRLLRSMFLSRKPWSHRQPVQKLPPVPPSQQPVPPPPQHQQAPAMLSRSPPLLSPPQAHAPMERAASPVADLLNLVPAPYMSPEQQSVARQLTLREAWAPSTASALATPAPFRASDRVLRSPAGSPPATPPLSSELAVTARLREMMDLVARDIDELNATLDAGDDGPPETLAGSSEGFVSPADAYDPRALLVDEAVQDVDRIAHAEASLRAPASALVVQRTLEEAPDETAEQVAQIARAEASLVAASAELVTQRAALVSAAAALVAQREAFAEERSAPLLPLSEAAIRVHSVAPRRTNDPPSARAAIEAAAKEGMVQVELAAAGAKHATPSRALAAAAADADVDIIRLLTRSPTHSRTMSHARQSHRSERAEQPESALRPTERATLPPREAAPRQLKISRHGSISVTSSQGTVKLSSSPVATTSPLRSAPQLQAQPPPHASLRTPASPSLSRSVSPPPELPAISAPQAPRVRLSRHGSISISYPAEEEAAAAKQAPAPMPATPLAPMPAARLEPKVHTQAARSALAVLRKDPAPARARPSRIRQPSVSAKPLPPRPRWSTGPATSSDSSSVDGLAARLRAVRRVPVRSSAVAATPVQKRVQPHATGDSGGGGASPRDARLIGKLQEAMLLLGAKGTAGATGGGGDDDGARTARIQAKLQLAMSLMGGDDLGEESESAATSFTALKPDTLVSASDEGGGAKDNDSGGEADAVASEAPAGDAHEMPTVHISRRGSITVTMPEEQQQRTPLFALEAVATHAAANTAFIVAHRAASEAMGAANSAYSQLKEDLAARLMQTTARGGSAKKEVRMLRSIAIARDAPRRPRSGGTMARAATSPRAKAVCTDLGKALSNNDAVSAGEWRARRATARREPPRASPLLLVLTFHAHPPLLSTQLLSRTCSIAGRLFADFATLVS